MNKASRMLFAYQLRQVLPGIIVAFIPVLVMLWFYLGDPLFTIYDETGKPVQHQTGTVTNVIGSGSNESEPLRLMSSRLVVLVQEQPQAVVVHQVVFRERKRLPHKPCQTLAQDVVEPLRVLLG